MNEQSYLTDVLAFAGKGNSVFPVRNKRPLVEWTQAATSDPGVIEAWWRQYGKPDYAWAVPEGIVVVDIDDRAAFDAAELDLPRTAMQETPRGEHWVYQLNGHPVEQRTKVAPGTDLRVGGKGYIVLYDPRRLLANKAPVPGWVEAGEAERPAAPRQLTGDVMGTRDDILLFLGSTAHAGKGFGVGVYRAMLASLRDAGTIVALDPARPWTDDDLEELAEQAEAWDRKAISDRGLEERVEAALRKSKPAEAEPQDEGSLLEQTGFRFLESIERIDPPPLLLGRWAPDGASILYGTGGVGKGRLASQEIASLTKADPYARILIVDYEDHEQEWRNRIEQCGGDLSRIVLVAPFSSRWKGNPKDRTITDHAELLRRIASQLGITYLVIDSAMMAVPGIDVGDPAAPQAWSVALQHIGLPSLTLGHVTKADSDPAYPFGSVYWHNLARITWSMSASDDDRIRLRNRKANNYQRPASLILEEPQPVGAFQVIGNFFDLRSEGSWKDRLVDVLELGPMTVAEIVSALDDQGFRASRQTVRTTLVRGNFHPIGDKWGLGSGEK